MMDPEGAGLKREVDGELRGSLDEKTRHRTHSASASRLRDPPELGAIPQPQEPLDGAGLRSRRAPRHLPVDIPRTRWCVPEPRGAMVLPPVAVSAQASGRMSPKGKKPVPASYSEPEADANRPFFQ